MIKKLFMFVITIFIMTGCSNLEDYEQIALDFVKADIKAANGATGVVPDVCDYAMIGKTISIYNTSGDLEVVSCDKYFKSYSGFVTTSWYENPKLNGTPIIETLQVWDEDVNSEKYTHHYEVVVSYDIDSDYGYIEDSQLTILLFQINGEWKFVIEDIPLDYSLVPVNVDRLPFEE
ncbi:hypothetical protein RJG79_10815 [Mycoplasmatota bacterium WC44]